MSYNVMCNRLRMAFSFGVHEIYPRLCVSIAHCFLLLSSTPLYEYTMVSLCIYELKDIGFFHNSSDYK